MARISHFRLHEAARQVRQGAVIAYPTEAVYGLGCDPLNEAAVMNLLALKQRPVEKGLILIAADFAQLAPFLQVDESMCNRILPTWEKQAITWLMPVKKSTPKWLTGEHSTLAVRVTHHPLAKALCAELGSPLVSTSANPNTQKPALTALQVRRYFANQVHIVAGATGGNQKPSAIYDAQTGACLR